MENYAYPFLYHSPLGTKEKKERGEKKIRILISLYHFSGIPVPDIIRIHYYDLE